MRTVAHIAEVVDLICKQADRGSLCVMARSSQMLHEQAIRGLWRELPGLVPLLQSFPRDAWVIDRGLFKFTRHLTLRDWTSFLKYASLVWDLSGGQYRYRPDNTVWMTVACLRPIAILLPSLRTVCWRDLHLSENCLPSFLICTGQRLTRLEVEGYGADILRATFGLVAERFLDLREMVVGNQVRPIGYSVTAEPPFILPSLACSFASLASLTMLNALYPLTEVLRLARMKTLRSLAIRLSTGVTDAAGHLSHPEAQVLPAQAPISQLEELLLHTTAQDFIAFSKATALPYATSLKVRLYGDIPPHLVSQLFVSIRATCSPEVVQILEVGPPMQTGAPRAPGAQGLGAPQGPPGAPSSWSLWAQILPIHLRPLLEFKRLAVVELVGLRDCYWLDDDFCAEMAHAWPRLESLSIYNLLWDYSDLILNDSALPSVRALPLFAAHCPRLQSLGLEFDGACWQSEAQFEAERLQGDIFGPLVDKASTSGLSTLRVHTSPIRGPEYVAAYLARIFPSLENIWVTRPPVGEDGSMNDERRPEQWGRVRRLLHLFKQIRRDEYSRHIQRQALAN